MPNTTSGSATAAAQKIRSLKPEQWAAVMVLNGFPSDETVIATGLAVLSCENGFRTHGQDFARSGHFGGWQEEAGFGGCQSQADRENYIRSTQCAAAEWKSRGWEPWAASQHCWQGKIDRYRPAARKGIAGAAQGVKGLENQMGVGTGDVLPHIDVAGALTSIATVLEKVAQFFVGLGELLLTPEGWARIGKLIFGAGLIIYGLNALSKQLTGANPVGAAKKAGVVAAAAL